MINVPLNSYNYQIEELINGMLLILKYQPDANYNFDYDYIQFGYLDRHMSDDDKWQLLKWNWVEDTENNHWSHT